MSISKQSSLNNSQRFFHLAINGFGRQIISGIIYHSSRKAGIHFDCLLDMVWTVNQIFDQIQCPMQSMNTRNFDGLQMVMANKVLGSEPRDMEPEPRTRGSLATLELFVKYRYYASWQGHVHWLEKDQIIEFNSFLELVRILNSILSTDKQDPELEDVSYKHCKVAVDCYGEHRMQGRMLRPGSHEPWMFCSVIALMLRMDRMFEPYRDENVQDGRVQEKVIYNRTLGVYHARGKIVTFLIRVRFNENATWQGTIYWKENHKRTNFRSFLELIMLMDAALVDQSCWQKNGMQYREIL